MHLFVALPSLRRRFSRDLRTAGGLATRSAGVIPPLSSLIVRINSRAASLERAVIIPVRVCVASCSQSFIDET